MKKLTLLLIVVLFASCDFRNNQKKAESLVIDYLNSKYATNEQFSIVKTSKVDTLFAADHTTTGWYIYTTYIHKTPYGSLKNHSIVAAIDPGFNKITMITERSH